MGGTLWRTIVILMSIFEVSETKYCMYVRSTQKKATFGHHQNIPRLPQGKNVSTIFTSPKDKTYSGQIRFHASVPTCWVGAKHSPRPFDPVVPIYVTLRAHSAEIRCFLPEHQLTTKFPFATHRNRDVSKTFSPPQACMLPHNSRFQDSINTLIDCAFSCFNV